MIEEEENSITTRQIKIIEKSKWNSNLISWGQGEKSVQRNLTQNMGNLQTDSLTRRTCCKIITSFHTESGGGRGRESIGNSLSQTKQDPCKFIIYQITLSERDAYQFK